VLNRYEVDFPVVLRLLKEHQLLFPISVSSTSTGAAAEEEPAEPAESLSWVVPVKLPPSPPDGFEAACALGDGDSAWQTVGLFDLFFLPPGLVQMTIASLHRLGAYVEYYQQGGFMETKDQTMKHVCYFDLVSSCRGVPSRPKISPTTASVSPRWTSASSFACRGKAVARRCSSSSRS